MPDFTTPVELIAAMIAVESNIAAGRIPADVVNQHISNCEASLWESQRSSPDEEGAERWGSIKAAFVGTE